MVQLGGGGKGGVGNGSWEEKEGFCQQFPVSCFETFVNLCIFLFLLPLTGVKICACDVVRVCLGGKRTPEIQKKNEKQYCENRIKKNFYRCV